MNERYDGTSRRRLLQAGVLSAGVVIAPELTRPEEATAKTTQAADTEHPRFTLAVVPDTQYLFDLDRGDSAPLIASFEYLIEQRAAENIVFTAHLGDVVENAQASEFAQADPVFKVLDGAGMPYSVLAGNHDIDSSKDDTRGDSPYLRTFGPQRFRPMPTYGGSTPTGYNSYHVFRAAGRQWLLLAMDWRPSDASFAWARAVIAAHPRLPVILTIHDLVYADAGDPEAKFSDHGDRVWEQLVDGNDQIFLTLNGHYWPSGRVVRKNAAGRDVHLHITNYQDRYYGGSAMMRLYHFDLARNTIDVETISPWILGQDPARRSLLAEGEIELTDDTNRFSVEIDFEQRFAGFAPVAPRTARPAGQLLVPGTVAYWRLDGSTESLKDWSGSGNDLSRMLLSGTGPNSVRLTDDHHDDQPAHASFLFDGSKNPARGAYFQTADHAPVNTMTFGDGYTMEAFVKLHPDTYKHAWMALLCRRGTGGDAGKTGGDPSEPVATLSVSDGRGMQWAVFPVDRNDIWTNWSHEIPAGQWFHLAVVNDGQTSTMYIESSPVLRNPATPSNGISTIGAPWMLGAYHYANVIEQGFYGWVGDVRIVDRPLQVDAFMNA